MSPWYGIGLCAAGLKIVTALFHRRHEMHSFKSSSHYQVILPDVLFVLTATRNQGGWPLTVEELADLSALPRKTPVSS
jgi:hypothetical protein